MGKFTKFGVWDDGVKDLIGNICDISKIERSELKDWFYDVGVLLFIKEKARLYSLDKNRMTKPDNVAAATRDAFLSLLPELLKKFAANNPSLRIRISAKFKFTANSEFYISHRSFYDLQALATAALLKLLKQEPNTPRSKQLAFIATTFSEFKETRPDQQHAINAHLLLMSEFSKLISQQHQASSGRLFNADVAQEEEKLDSSDPGLRLSSV